MLILVSVLLAGSATAQAAVPAAPATSEAPTKSGAQSERGSDRVICKDGVNITGTRMPTRRRCMMKREWDRRNQNDSEATRALQNSSILNKIL